MPHSTFRMYHMFLRVLALSVAFVLLFDSGLLSPVTRDLSLGTQSYLASVVSMYATVEPTELNSYTAQLTKKERELDDREAALTEREHAIGLAKDQSGVGGNASTYILSVILFILVVLIVLNYALDFAREKELGRRRALQHESTA